MFYTSVKCLKIDNGSEFFRNEFMSLLATIGIMHQSSCVYTPQQNGVVKRKHKIILKMASPKVHDKFSPRVIPIVLIGYSSTQEGYILYDLYSKTFLVNRNVIFQENIYPFKHMKKSSNPLFPVLDFVSSDPGNTMPLTSVYRSSTPDGHNNLQPSSPVPEETTIPDHSSDLEPAEPPPVNEAPQEGTLSTPKLRKSSGDSRPPLWLQDCVVQSKGSSVLILSQLM
ncbi:uncharacterized protein [Nicotiana tomentosiformis]|uniref:uncharacterized protein n=1 Tax=Nicotiana tomentosiformis TaxID=4098 RepID=UPI00388C3784